MWVVFVCCQFFPHRPINSTSILWNKNMTRFFNRKYWTEIWCTRWSFLNGEQQQFNHTMNASYWSAQANAHSVYFRRVSMDLVLVLNCSALQAAIWSPHSTLRENGGEGENRKTKQIEIVWLFRSRFFLWSRLSIVVYCSQKIIYGTRKTPCLGLRMLIISE